MLAIFLFLVIVLAIAVLVWNFVPAVREKLRGWTTILEAVLTTAVTIFGQVTGALQDAQHAGYLPTQLAGYVPYVLLAWMVYKRVTTSTPPGSAGL